MRVGRVRHGAGWDAPPLEREGVANSIIDACANGNLQSFARLKSASGEPNPIGKSSWFGDGVGDACAVRLDLDDVTLSDNAAWLFVDNDQLASVIGQPPGAQAVAPAWHVQPGERQKAWALRSDVIAEGMRRRTAVSNAGLCAAMADMAADCGVSWSAATLATVRRRHKDSSRT